MYNKPSQIEIQQQIEQVLAEDIGSGDLTASLIPAEQTLCLQLWLREAAILCGQDWFVAAFQTLDPSCRIDWLACEGDRLPADAPVAKIEGNARALLSAERTALNFLQTLSGTATVAARFQQQMQGTNCRLLDTRKTLPGLRLAQKYAVACGGGMNHRIGLFDAILIKENHIEACGSIRAALHTARRLHATKMLEVEVETLAQLEEAISAGANRALLDNFHLAGLQQCVALNQGRIELEASGNMQLENLAAVAATGVDFISTGAITKHLHAIDFSLRFCAQD